MTIYIRVGRCNAVSAYVKYAPTPKSVELNSSVMKVIFSVSACLLRVEKINRSPWLSARNLKNPQCWRSSKEALRIYKDCFDELLTYLRLDKKFRQRMPKPEYNKKLTEIENSVLDWHFEGKSYKTHPDISGKSCQYISRVKRQIEMKMFVDMSIPWKIQSKKLSPMLKEKLVWTKQFKVPAELEPYCFISKTVRVEYEKLRALVNDEINSQIAKG